MTPDHPYSAKAMTPLNNSLLKLPQATLVVDGVSIPVRLLYRQYVGGPSSIEVRPEGGYGEWAVPLNPDYAALLERLREEAVEEARRSPPNKDL